MRRGLQKLTWYCLAVVLCLFARVVGAESVENSVVVESKQVFAGTDSVRIGVHLSNSAPVYILYLPLEIRSMTPGAFVRDPVSFGLTPGARVQKSGLMDYSCGWEPPFPLFDQRNHLIPDSASHCSGPVASSYPGYRDSMHLVSPRAYYIKAEGCGGMPPGGDAPVQDSASCQFYFAVSSTPGQFAIDTCCVGGNHIWFEDFGTGAIPTFTRGVITIVPCNCVCHGDPNCDGLIDVVDVVHTISIAFGGAPADTSLSGECPVETTDLNCDGATGVIDVVQMINVAFRGADAASVLCVPCQ